MNNNKSSIQYIIILVLLIAVGFIIGTVLRTNPTTAAAIDKLPLIGSSNRDKLVDGEEPIDEPTDEPDGGLTVKPTAKPKATAYPKPDVPATPQPAKTASPIEGNESDFEYITEGNGIKITAYLGDKTNVIIPSKINGKTVTIIGSAAFSLNYDIVSVVIPSGVVEIEDALMEETDEYATYGAFSGCFSLQNVTLPNTLKIIGASAFDGCGSIESITIPSSVKEIHADAFFSCESLKNITIQNGLESIGEWSFGYCDSLETITLPKSIKLIDNSAFSASYQLRAAYFEGAAPQIGEYSFEYENFVIYYKSGTKGWSNPYMDYPTATY